MQINNLNKNTHNSKIANKLQHTYSSVTVYNKSSTVIKAYDLKNGTGVMS